MLCDGCKKHFDHSSPERRDELFEYKVRALARLKESFGHLRSEVKDFELDLQRFTAELQLHPDQTPCPWYYGNLSWLPYAYRSRQVELVVWGKEGRLGEDVDSSADQGCDLCRRLRLLVSQMSVFGEMSQVLFESSVYCDPISLKPNKIRFFVKGAVDGSLEDEWPEFKVAWIDGG